MTYKEFRDLIVKNTNTEYNEFGFFCKQVNKFGFELVQETEKLKLSIGIGFYDRANGYHISPGGYAIQYKEVEAIVFPLVLSHKLWDEATAPALPPDTFASYNVASNVVEMRNSFEDEYLVETEAELKTTFNQLKKYIETYCFPWFEKYSKLEEINEFINSSDMQDVLNSFSGPFPSGFYRAMVITEMCDNRKRSLEIREECLRRFADCKTDSFYTPVMIASYDESLQELCQQLDIQ
jgi:hypothetical protein